MQKNLRIAMFYCTDSAQFCQCGITSCIHSFAFPFVRNMLYLIQQIETCRGEAPPSCYARPFCHLKAPLGLSLFRFAPQTRIVYFFVLGAISNMTVTRIYKPYSNQVMVLFQGKLISGWFSANTINAIAIISIIKPRILDIRFFMQSSSLSNWNC